MARTEGKLHLLGDVGGCKGRRPGPAWLLGLLAGWLARAGLQGSTEGRVELDTVTGSVCTGPHWAGKQRQVEASARCLVVQMLDGVPSRHSKGPVTPTCSGDDRSRCDGTRSVSLVIKCGWWWR